MPSRAVQIIAFTVGLIALVVALAIAVPYLYNLGAIPVLGAQADAARAERDRLRAEAAAAAALTPQPAGVVVIIPPAASGTVIISGTLPVATPAPAVPAPLPGSSSSPAAPAIPATIPAGFVPASAINQEVRQPSSSIVADYPAAVAAPRSSKEICDKGVTNCRIGIGENIVTVLKSTDLIVVPGVGSIYNPGGEVMFIGYSHSGGSFFDVTTRDASFEQHNVIVNGWGPETLAQVRDYNLITSPISKGCSIIWVAAERLPDGTFRITGAGQWTK